VAQIESGRAAGVGAARGIAEGPVERLCKWICVAALVVMLVVIGLDIATRSLFNFSFEISDELGGYMLVVITFLSLSVCQINDSFHHVELVQARLSPRGRAVSHVIFDLLSLAFCLLLLWQLFRFELSSWRFDDKAPTYLATPLWMPRLVMVLGAAALCFSVLRTLAADLRKLRAGGVARRRALGLRDGCPDGP
jgi:TRAP-type C4-dicarboxylate transport system permease small subunit